MCFILINDINFDRVLLKTPTRKNQISYRKDQKRNLNSAQKDLQESPINFLFKYVDPYYLC